MRRGGFKMISRSDADEKFVPAKLFAAVPKQAYKNKPGTTPNDDHVMYVLNSKKKNKLGSGLHNKQSIYNILTVTIIC